MLILRSSLVAAVAALAALLLVSLPVKAQTVAVSFTQNALGAEDFASDNAFGNGVPGYNLGYEFSVSAPVTVTSVGFYYDPVYDYTQDHPVGIYDLAGNLLGSGTVSENTANDSSIGAFMYSPLAGAGLALTPGDYVIAGLTGPNDPYLFDIQDYTDPNNPGNALITAPGIGYIQDYSAVSTPTSTLTDDAPSPSGDNMPGSYFGPNFQFVGGIVPESSSLVLILPSLLVLAALFAVRRRRQQKARAE